VVIPKPFNNHNGGQLAFGPEGYLYIGVGDGGSQGDPYNNAQNTGTLLGKLLRIDVERGGSPYAIPTNNPFLGNTNYSPEIWALGLQNPWRFSFDRLTGDFYLGDVGGNQFEEVDFQPAGSPGGQNYGWRIMEGDANFNVPPGFTNFPSLTLPVAVYSHASLPYGQGAVTGGYVYRGPSVPRMDGVYFYGDFVSGWIWGMKPMGTNWESIPIVSPGRVAGIVNISTFGEDDAANLYLADYYRGVVYQMTDSLHVWTPTFSPPGGVINSHTVVINCVTPGADMHYTTNGVDPTQADPLVASGSTIVVATGVTNKLRAFRADLAPSAVATAIYTVQVAAPTFSPPSGASVTMRIPVSISTITPAGIIYYTTNGTTPTTNSLLYGSFYISDPARIRRIAPNGTVSTLAGSGAVGYQNGLGVSASFKSPAGIAEGPGGIVSVADAYNNCIRQIPPDTAGIGIADWWQRA
jgi:hypothetical protein